MSTLTSERVQVQRRNRRQGVMGDNMVTREEQMRRVRNLKAYLLNVPTGISDGNDFYPRCGVLVYSYRPGQHRVLA